MGQQSDIQAKALDAPSQHVVMADHAPAGKLHRVGTRAVAGPRHVVFQQDEVPGGLIVPFRSRTASPCG